MRYLSDREMASWCPEYKAAKKSASKQLSAPRWKMKENTVKGIPLSFRLVPATKR
jgi:hypothetical protein